MQLLVNIVQMLICGRAGRDFIHSVM